MFVQVYGWEPSRVFDMLPVHWGKVEDMIISGEQLVKSRHPTHSIVYVVIHTYVHISTGLFYILRGLWDCHAVAELE